MSVSEMWDVQVGYILRSAVPCVLLTKSIPTVIDAEQYLSKLVSK